MTVRNWGESSVGNWTITVDDGYIGDLGTWVDFQLILHGVPAASGCPVSLNIPDAPMSSDTYEASQSITASGTVANGGDVSFAAGVNILLEPNFSAMSGSKFLANIKDCTTAVQSPNTTYSRSQEATQQLVNATNPPVSLKVYPNPVHQEINLAFHLQTRERISLEIYDALGKKVKTILSSTYKDQGTYSIPLSIDDAFQNGIYLVILRTERQQLSKKISVLR